MYQSESTESSGDSIPIGWTAKSLGQLTSALKAGGTPKRDVKEFWGGDIPFVKIEDITHTQKYITSTVETITSEGLLASSAWVIQPDAVLLTMYATIGEVAVNKIPVATNQAIIALMPTQEVTSEYLYYALKYTGRQLHKYNVQSTQKNINKGIVERFTVPLPPLPEQRRIASVLNTIQDAIAAQEDVIAAAGAFKRSLMQRLFTYGPGREPAPTRETEIGEIPAHWEVTPLKQQASIDYGIQAAVAHLKDASIGVPILTNINIGLDGEIDLATLRYYPLKDSQHDKLLNDGDVLFNWRSGSATHVGKTALFKLKHPYTFSSFILRFRPTNHVSSRYLTWFFRFMHASGFFSFRRDQSSVNSVINASSAAELPVAFPVNPFEQAAIVEQIEAANAKIAAEEDRKTALDALFKSMLHQLMTGQIRLLSDEGLPLKPWRLEA